METTVSATDLKQHYGDILQKLHDGPVIVTSYNREVAVILSIREYNTLRPRRKKAKS